MFIELSPQQASVHGAVGLGDNLVEAKVVVFHPGMEVSGKK